ncbi:MAG TPA: ABC transporter ATP-binding protein [Actinomycetota bacterium]|nr:ABC transporter ATP-binding protein [Actinomycetota bacterium]
MTEQVAPLDARDITVSYGGLRALDHVSLRVEAGQTVGLIGPNGAGKTTLFDAVLGLVRPEVGRVLLFGEDVTGWPVHRRARLGLGRTFQRLELFGSLSVAENIIVALESLSGVGGLAGEVLRRPTSIDVRRRAEGRAAELLDLVGLTDQARTRSADLPMGMARVLEIARALATNPRLLLLDEPSSGLNEEESENLARLLKTLRSETNLALLVVEHDMDFVLGLSQSVYVLDFGKLIASGSPRKIRKDRTVQAAYLGEEVPGAAAARG